MRKARIPLWIPGIKPVMKIVRSKKDVKVCVVGFEWKLHEQKWQMNDHNCEKNEAEWDRLRC